MSLFQKVKELVSHLGKMYKIQAQHRKTQRLIKHIQKYFDYHE